MARTLVLAVIACAASAAVGFAANDVAVTVSPAHGSTRKTFTVKFMSRENLGVNGIAYSSYRVVATGPHASTSCMGDAEATVDHGAAGDRVRVPLVPPAGGRWCAGRFSGKLFYEHGPYCPSDHTGPCPAFPSTMTEVGHFKFRVGR